MNLREGDWVFVNLAPFIGSCRRCQESIPCRVLAIDGTHVEIRTDYPLRVLSLAVLATWIEGKLEPDEGDARFQTPFSAAAGVRQAAVGTAPGRTSSPRSRAALCETVH